MSFFRKNKERMMVTAVAIILIIIIGITSTERIGINKIEKITGNILTPIGKIFNSIGKNVSGFFDNLKDIGRLREENESMKEQIAKLEEENRRYVDIIGKTDYLKNEANLLQKTSFNLITGQIVGKEPGNWFDRFTIDKGLKDGIQKGDTVVQGIEVEQNVIVEGIVGRVIDVGDNWAKIITIVDNSNNVSFRILRTQDGGMMSGRIGGEISGYLFDNKADVISGYLFDNKADVIKGDKLFTSGLGGAFVKDIYIGEVEEVINDEEDLMKKIYVKPAINFKKLYKVFIISNGIEG